MGKSINKFSGEPCSIDDKCYLDFFISRALNPNKSHKQKILRTGDTHSHKITLFSIALSIQAKALLETGVRRGGTTLPLLYASYLTGGILDSVDIKRTKFQPPPKMKKYWRFHKQDAIKYLERVPERKIYDLIYIDDWHSYEHVKKEIELVKRHITNKSLIILHDLMVASAPEYNIIQDTPGGEFEGGGPARAILELSRDLWEWSTIPVCNGLTILRLK